MKKKFIDKVKQQLKDAQIDMKVKHYMWEEDGITYSAWELPNGAITGDGGMELFNKVLEDEIKNLDFSLDKTVPVKHFQEPLYKPYIKWWARLLNWITLGLYKPRII